jgi:protein associated with RNAse G/E
MHNNASTIKIHLDIKEFSDCVKKCCVVEFFLPHTKAIMYPIILQQEITAVL